MASIDDGDFFHNLHSNDFHRFYVTLAVIASLATNLASNAAKSRNRYDLRNHYRLK
jgi:hypothetical protein